MSLALYRKHRPGSFAEVVGQEHVTGPLSQALRNDKVHHAYLFSGPRGCGKTSSARILARSLNCEQGPTPEPCGVCQSCIELAPNGPGSLDVLELDAATNRGIDDARELRERAFYAPASSRFKVYIVDEAHQLTTEAANALLKVVEEPPPHLKFIFATTEPDKIIGTIRSRTHHYPFRLVPPKALQAHLGRICELEGVTIGKGVLPLVVRAGRGSVRDSLSVLDQLIGGAGPDGVDYAMATGLLGYTDSTLLDDVVDAVSASDGATVFAVVDHLVEAGHDPRRFLEDLLERLRDLIVLAAVPDSAVSILHDVPEDQVERMRAQAARFGAADLSRAADIVAVGLTEMRGATAPRLQLELVCARVLLPGAYDDGRSLHARLDRVERRLTIGGAVSSDAPPERASEAPAPGRAAAAAAAAASAAAVQRAEDPGDTRADAREDAAPPAAAAPATEAPATEAPATDGRSRPAPTEPAPVPTSAAVAADGDGRIDLATVRRMWPDVLAALAGLKRTTWSLVSANAQVVGIDGRRLTLAFTTSGLRDTFAGGAHPELVRQALIDVLGLDCQVEAVVDPSAGAGASRAAREPEPDAAPAAPRADPAAVEAARAAARTPAASAESEPVEADEPSIDDADVDDGGVSGPELVARMLGGTTINEIRTD